MVVDTSALCAVLLNEPEEIRYSTALASPGRKLMSAVNALEATLVVESRMGPAGTKRLLDLIDASMIDIVAFDTGLSEIAADAWRRFGKGRHPAGLNLGDCAAYALAKVTHQPLLFKGGDFGQTDIPEALS